MYMVIWSVPFPDSGVFKKFNLTPPSHPRNLISQALPWSKAKSQKSIPENGIWACKAMNSLGRANWIKHSLCPPRVHGLGGRKRHAELIKHNMSHAAIWAHQMHQEISPRGTEVHPMGVWKRPQGWGAPKLGIWSRDSGSNGRSNIQNSPQQFLKATDCQREIWCHLRWHMIHIRLPRWVWDSVPQRKMCPTSPHIVI